MELGFTADTFGTDWDPGKFIRYTAVSPDLAEMRAAFKEVAIPAQTKNANEGGRPSINWNNISRSSFLSRLPFFNNHTVEVFK